MWAARFTPQQAAKALAAQTSSQFVPRFDPKVPPSAVLKKLLRSCCPFSLQNEVPPTRAEACTPDNSIAVASCGRPGSPHSKQQKLLPRKHQANSSRV
jgi:hypothetical protein